MRLRERLHLFLAPGTEPEQDEAISRAWAEENLGGTGSPSEIPAEYLTESEGDGRYSLTAHDHPVATDTAHGFMSWQNFNKLLGIAAGAQVNPTDDYIRNLNILPANTLSADAPVTVYPMGLSIVLAGSTTTGWPAGPSSTGTVQTFKSFASRATQYYVSGGQIATTWVRSWSGTETGGAWTAWSSVQALSPFAVHHTLSTQNTAVGATMPSKIWFATKVYDPDTRIGVGANMTNALQSRYTARYAGVVKFGGGMGFTAPAGITGTKYAKLYLRHAAVATSTVTDYLLDERPFRDSERVACRGVRQIMLAAGDTVELHGVQDSGSSVALLVDKDYTFFWGEVTGA